MINMYIASIQLLFSLYVRRQSMDQHLKSVSITIRKRKKKKYI